MALQKTPQEAYGPYSSFMLVRGFRVRVRVVGGLGSPFFFGGGSMGMYMAMFHDCCRDPLPHFQPCTGFKIGFLS